MCSCDVPRNANGWPTVEPQFFTERQLRKEGERWRKTALETYSGTVGYGEWEKYARELHARGFIEIVDPRVPLLENDKTFARNRTEADRHPDRPSIWSIFSRKTA